MSRDEHKALIQSKYEQRFDDVGYTAHLRLEYLMRFRKESEVPWNPLHDTFTQAMIAKQSDYNDQIDAAASDVQSLAIATAAHFNDITP